MSTHDTEHKHDGQPGVDVVLHAYDDIQEYDNALPNWWLVTFYGAILFAAFYWFGYHVFKSMDLPPAAFVREMEELKAKEAKTAVPVTPEALVALSKDKAALAKGQEVFTTTCAPCHNANASGNIGPNLTDEFWINGGKPEQIHKTISEGVGAKGMPAWGPSLGADRTQAVSAFVLSLRNTNVAGGKAPQGTKE